MRDEMARAKTRLELKFLTSTAGRPYYVEYRLLDLEVREVVAEFGTLFSSTHTRNRFMTWKRVSGSYKLTARICKRRRLPRFHRTDRAPWESIAITIR